MSVVLCYGDSNTHGYIAGTGARYPFDIRWTGVLQNQLGSGVRVIEEGLSGRTTTFDVPGRAGRNGAAFLPICLESHSPIDVLVLMLGTNDVLQKTSLTVQGAASGVSSLINIVKETCAHLALTMPNVLLVAPPQVADLEVANELGNSLRNVKTYDFSTQYRHIADVHNCKFLDASKLVHPSKIDGIHLDEDAHKKLGIEIARMTESLF